MQFAARLVAMDLSTEGLLHLLHRAAEDDPTPTASCRYHREILRSQPCHHQVEAFLSDAEAVAEFLWSQPSVVVRRGRVLLFGEQAIKRRALRGCAPERQRNVREDLPTSHSAAVIVQANVRPD
jgi:hypothetical protein